MCYVEIPVFSILSNPQFYNQCLYIVLQGELVYEAYGDGAALYYFAITSSGQIYVRNSLQGVTQGVYNVSTHYRYNCSITTCKDKAENIG